MLITETDVLGVICMLGTSQLPNNFMPSRNFQASSVFTLYTLTSVCIFSILFSINSQKNWQGEFVSQSGAPLVGDHFQGWYHEEKSETSHSQGGGQRVDWHNFWKIKCNAKLNSNQLKSQKKVDMWMVFFGETFIILYRRAGAGKININSYWQLTRRDHFLLDVGLGPRQNFQFPMKTKPQALRFHPLMLYCWATGTPLWAWL